MKIKRIKELREKHGFTTQYVADNLGIPEKLYIKYEEGDKSMTTNDIIQLSNLYNLSTDYILERTDSKRRH